MRDLGLILLGCVIGGTTIWFAKGDVDEPARTTRSNASRSEQPIDRDAGTDERAKARKQPQPEPEQAEPAEVPKPEAKPDGPDPLKEMVRAMSKQWKTMAAMFAKRNMKGQLVELGFDAETAKRIEELVAAEAGRQTERALAMMVGDEELDPDAVYWFFGNGPEISTELERDLARFLNDDEVATVRAELKKNHEQQLIDMADMTIGMMGVQDLSDDQKTSVREVFAGKDFMRQQFKGMAEITRDSKRLRHILENPDAFEKEVRTTMAPYKQRMQDILRPEQMKQYERFETQFIRMQQMQMKMMSTLFEQPAEKPPAKSGQ